MDDLICRDKNGERLYSLQDANWNCVCVTDETGTVQERYVYDAFGRVEGLASDWNRTFTGQVYDNETGLMLYRNRFYSPELGRFLQRDPIGYEGQNLNIYCYVFNQTHSYTDSLGLFRIIVTVLPPPTETTVSIYNDQAGKANGTIAGSDSFGGVAKRKSKKPNVIPMRGKGLDGIVGDDGWGDKFGDKKCIKTLNIIDHGSNGTQWIGDKPLEDFNLNENGLCNLLCDDATVYLYGCNVAKVEEGNIPPSVQTVLDCGNGVTVKACDSPMKYTGGKKPMTKCTGKTKTYPSTQKNLRRNKLIM